MSVKAMVSAALIVWGLAGPGVVGDALAAPLPAYFADGAPAFACLEVTPPSGAPFNVLVQANFDKVLEGGIPTTRADALFAYVLNLVRATDLQSLGSIRTTCSMTPSQVQGQFAGLTGLQAAQQLSGAFTQRGFAAYLIADTYLSVAIALFDTLRVDVFRVVGANNIDYVGSIERARSAVP